MFKDGLIISGVLRKINYSGNIRDIQNVIYGKIREKIIDLTFENLVRKGCIL